MFKKFLSTIPQASANSAIPSPPSQSPSPSTSPKPTKTSPMKAAEDSQVSSSGQIRLTEHAKVTNVNDNDSNDDVPDLILPPSPPSEIATLSDATNERNPSSGENHRGHTRDDSLETTISQSMDLSSFIKCLELEEEENQKQKQELEHGHKKKAPKRSDSSLDGSLSLAASQVDISLAEDTENIKVESGSCESENNIIDNGNGNTNKATENKPENTNDSELVVTNEPTDPVFVNHPSSLVPPHSASAKSGGHDSYPMAHVGEQLFRESLRAGKEENDPKKTQTVVADDTPEQKASKSKSATKAVTKMLTTMFFVIVITVFVFHSEGDMKADHVAKTATLSTGCDFMIKKCEEPSKFDAQVQAIGSSKTTDSDEASYDSSDYLVEELNELFNSTESTGDWASDHLFEDEMNDKPSDDGSHGWVTFIFLNAWPMALLFVAYRLFSSLRFCFVSSPSSTKEKFETEIRMEAETLRTPPRFSARRNRDGFLTPPLSCESIAKEPTEWMSPCYGNDALDISVYKSMKHAELRKLLRDRKVDTRGKKEQMIKMLVMSYQNELSCLTVAQLRPKLRRRNLSLKGTKKDIIRRLVEAGPDMPKKA
eukprot:CAMPEP_0116113476 /NCGR_PEP_ID=MMETSP0327-20121206/19528_1 /TAXON_ID=44447 /ORGANISM="Pseudo-nitzschia delicatissima, Strain B596" /LENGTH=596 /DNA_ID=CAMNT_0003606835 /DNA_START=94 /DNA_END=1884 /DNA_ORIENTATION=-